MANLDTPFGLRPVRHRLGAPINGALIPCYINSSYGTALFIGDAVIKVAGGSNASAITVPGVGQMAIGTMPEVQSAEIGDGKAISGVIVSFAAVPTDLETIHSKASVEGVAFVNMDPNTVFEIQADGAVPAADMGFNAVLIATHAGSTTTGLSGMELDTTSDVPAADASNQLLILNAVNREDNDTTITHPKVEVLIGLHTEAHGVTANTTDGILGI